MWTALSKQKCHYESTSWWRKYRKLWRFEGLAFVSKQFVAQEAPPKSYARITPGGSVIAVDEKAGEARPLFPSHSVYYAGLFVRLLDAHRKCFAPNRNDILADWLCFQTSLVFLVVLIQTEPLRLASWLWCQFWAPAAAASPINMQFMFSHLLLLTDTFLL